MTKIIQRHDTAANWTSINPVLALGEMGVETDTNKFKFGDGVTDWSELAYAAGEGGGGGSGTTLTSADGATTYSKLAIGDTLSVTDTSTKELNRVTQTGGTLNSELEFTGASGASLKMTEKYSLSTADSWEFQIKYKHNGGGGSPTIFGYAGGSDCKTPVFIYEGGSLKIYMSSNGSSWNLNSSNSGLVPQTGTTYYFKVGFTGSQYYIKYNTTGWSGEFTTQWTLNSTTKVYCSDYFMLMNLSLNSNYYNTGTMYLQDTALIINGSEVWRGARVIPGPITLNANFDDVTEQVNTLESTKQDKLTAVDSIYIEERNMGQLTQDWYLGDTKISNPATITTADVGKSNIYYPFHNQKLETNKDINLSFDIAPSFGSQGSGNKILFEWANNRGGVKLSPFWGYGIEFTVYAIDSSGTNITFVETGGIGGSARLNFSFSWKYTTKEWSCVIKNTENLQNVYSNSGTSDHAFTDRITTSPRISFVQSGHSTKNIVTIYNDTLAISSSDELSLVIGNSLATTSSLGVVQPDGTSITVSETGIISGQDVKTFTGYSDTGTLVLKSINGVLQWVAEG